MSDTTPLCCNFFFLLSREVYNMDYVIVFFICYTLLYYIVYYIIVVQTLFTILLYVTKRMSKRSTHILRPSKSQNLKISISLFGDVFLTQ